MRKIQRDSGLKLTNRVFTGEVDLGHELAHYTHYVVSTNVAVSLKANPIIGGSAEMRMVGDGSHTPVFASTFTKSTASEEFDTTAGVVNKVIFYHDGYQTFYSITVLA
jgi:hypothetical protein